MFNHRRSPPLMEVAVIDDKFKGFQVAESNIRDAKWLKVSELKVGDEIAVPDYETNTITWAKIVSIKVHEPQQVYDLSIENTHNFIANDIIAHNTARYFQYKADFNTTDAKYTPILNNVTINYTGIFTDGFGNYNYTFTAPSSAGNYQIKVNTTYANIISGEQSVVLQVRNVIAVKCDTAGCFITQDATGSRLMVIDSAGNVDIAGTLTQSATMTADTNDFVIQNSSAGLNAVITNPEGNLLIKNSLNQNQNSPLSPTLRAFIVQNKTGSVITYVNSTGGLFITGALTEQVLFN